MFEIIKIVFVILLDSIFTISRIVNASNHTNMYP